MHLQVNKKQNKTGLRRVWDRFSDHHLWHAASTSSSSLTSVAEWDCNPWRHVSGPHLLVTVTVAYYWSVICSHTKMGSMISMWFQVSSNNSIILTHMDYFIVVVCCSSAVIGTFVLFSSVCSLSLGLIWVPMVLYWSSWNQTCCEYQSNDHNINRNTELSCDHWYYMQQPSGSCWLQLSMQLDREYQEGRIRQRRSCCRLLPYSFSPLLSMWPSNSLIPTIAEQSHMMVREEKQQSDWPVD